MAIHAVAPNPTPTRLGGNDGISSKPVDLTKPTPTSFGDTLKMAINTVNETSIQADKTAGSMSTGKAAIDEAMIMLEKADIQFRLMTQVRNKVVTAYQEVMRLNF
jgi:flagellar hook-basal body complex protein FliE